MVCVPCIVIPVLLYIWHRFLQPIFLKFWNPWAKVNIKSLTPPAPTSMISLLCDGIIIPKSHHQVDTDKKVEGDGGSNGLPPGHAAAEKVNGASCPFSGKTTPEESKKTS